MASVNKKRKYIQLLKGILFIIPTVLVLAINSFFCPFLLGIPMIFNQKFIRSRILPPMTKWAFTCLAFIVQYIGGTKFDFRISNKTQEMLKNYNNNGSGTILFVSNHHSTLDWLFLTSLFGHLGLPDSIIIIMKIAVRKIPLIGWTVQYIGMFIARQWDNDKTYIYKWLKTTYSNKKHLVLLFPEGTIHEDISIIKSDKFADKMGWPHYKYVIHPRTKGLIHCVNTLKDNLYCIINCTLKFNDYKEGNNVHKFENLNVLRGKFVKDIYFYVECYTLNDIIKQTNMDGISNDDLTTKYYGDTIYKELDYNKNEHSISNINISNNNITYNEIEKGMTLWCHSIFKQKEILLKEYYTNNVKYTKEQINKSTVIPNISMIYYFKYILSHIIGLYIMIEILKYNIYIGLFAIFVNIIMCQYALIDKIMLYHYNEPSKID